MTGATNAQQPAVNLQMLEALSAELGNRLQQVPQSPAPQEVTDVMLAAYLAHNLTRGGFAQLFYNAGGQYLAEMAQMLQKFKTSNTLTHYENAVRVCLADQAAYQEFLASDFVTGSAFKNALHEVSLDYFRSSPAFLDEAGAELNDAIVRAKEWLSSPEQ